MQLQPGQFYQRADLHAHFGGQRQGEIVTPKAYPVILLFSSPKGEAYGYRDGWLEDRDLYLYSGEGTEGDMTLDRGNRAVLEHAAQGKRLLLFARQKERGPYLYVGEFAYVDHFWSWNTDAQGTLRKVLTFILKPINAVREGPEAQITPEQQLLLQRCWLGERSLRKADRSVLSTKSLWGQLCCDLTRISIETARLLCRAKSLGEITLSSSKGRSSFERSSFKIKEETLTDIVVLQLGELTLKDSRLRVFVHTRHLERRTGVDIELWFTDGSRGLGMAIQAKLPSEGKLEINVNQLKVLISHAKKCKMFPLYLLYTHVYSFFCKPFLWNCCWWTPKYIRQLGHWFASAYQVHQLFGNRYNYPSIRPVDYNQWRYLVWPWECPFCCPYLRQDHLRRGPLQFLREVKEMLLRTVFLDNGEYLNEYLNDIPSELPTYVLDLLNGEIGRLNDLPEDILPARHLVVVQMAGEEW